jgi:glutaryl-CoA dehydrogenase
VISEARDLLRGEGILLDRHVMRPLADVESLHTYAGADGRDITGASAFA